MTDTLTRNPKVEMVDRRQLLLRTVDVEQLVPEDDPVRAICELAGQMDLTLFYSAIGQKGSDPFLLFCSRLASD